MLKRFLFTLVILTASFIVCMENVVAIGSEGGSSGYGVWCDINSTSTFLCAFGRDGIGGASWRWYEWPEGEDSVEIPGYVNDIVPGVNINGGIITGCKEVGGYWRYAYVAIRHDDWNHYARYPSGGTTGFEPGDQVGLFPIGGNGYDVYRSNQLYLNGVRGSMYYNDREKENSGKTGSWSDVAKIYKAAQANDPDIFTKGWNGTSSLSWFCASSPEKSTFEGESAVMGTDNSSVDHHTISDSNKKFTGWAKASNTSRKATYTFTCNDKDNGCSLSFRHYLKRTSDSLGSTQYRIYRSYNGDDPKSYTVVKNKTDKNFTASYKSERVGSSDILTIRPGETICESMRFSLEGSPNGILGSNYGTTTICATATPTPTSSEAATLNMDVKNNNSTNDYHTYVYAKPTDKVEFRARYNPIPQQYYSSFSDGSITVSGITKKDWNNAFTITTDNFKINSANRVNHIYSAGDIESKTETNNYQISTSPLFNISSVGKILTETAMTNPLDDNGDKTNNSVWSTPTTIAKEGNNITATAGQLISTASVIVPYNFNNSVELEDQEDQESQTIVYAGESSSINYTIKVNPQKGKFVNQENGYNVKDNQYATVVREGKVKVCTGDSAARCGDEGVGEIVETSAIWNAFSHSFGATIKKNASVSIPDVPAGTQMCVAVAVYPANSDDGADNLDPEGNRQWAVSEPKCYTVAKKPSFQVWGGDIYSAGKIALDTAKKTNLSGYALGANEMRVFGSWGELAVISEGGTSGLASGAGFGYASNNNGTLSPNPFNGHYNTASDNPSPGGLEVSTSTPYLCKVSYLTFANTDCSSGATDGLSGSQNGGSAEEVKLPDGLITDSDRNTDIFKVGSIINLADPDSIKTTSNGVRYYHYASSSGGLEISNKNSNYKIPKNTVVVIESADNIFIKDNIFYDSTGYGSLEEIPKVIIYSEKNILIDYGIENIDAVLIAKGNINTCNMSSAGACSHQLRINGAVIAGGKLLLNRTYGAATGANSIVPAEIINYDPSLYSWNLSSRSPDSNTPSTWEQVYTSELAPRY